MRGIFIAVLLAMGMGLLIAPDISAAPIPGGGSAIMNAASEGSSVIQVRRRHEGRFCGDLRQNTNSRRERIGGSLRIRALDLARLGCDRACTA